MPGPQNPDPKENPEQVEQPVQVEVVPDVTFEYVTEIEKGDPLPDPEVLREQIAKHWE